MSDDTGRKGLGGPKTPEGKKITSMNGLKHGRYCKNFHRIPAGKAGNLAICIPCGDAQRAQCRIAGRCELQDEMTLRYHMMWTDRDPKHVEELTMNQLSMMDFLFSLKLKQVTMEMGETEEVVGKDGKVRIEPKVKNDDFYLLTHLANALSKTLPDMQLTRATQEAIGIEIAKLLEAKIDSDAAKLFKDNVLNSLRNYSDAQGEADEMKAQDEAIQEWLNQGDKSADADKALQPAKTGKNPFGSAGKK